MSKDVLQQVPVPEKFLPVSASPSLTCNVSRVELVDNSKSPTARKLSSVLDRPLMCDSGSKPLAVIRWNDPLAERFAGMPAYPEVLRSFTPVEGVSQADREQAAALVRDYGPFLPFPTDQYTDRLLRAVTDRNQQAVTHAVPEHQGRGFYYPEVYTFQIGNRTYHKIGVATKGNGITGYWYDQKRDELSSALVTGQADMPGNPDPFHARDHTGQSKGQKKGDEIVWVGLASDHVTRREVEGFNHMAEVGVFTPLPLPVERFNEIPLATGEVIDIAEFRDKFDSEAELVYLAKAWANETRIWGNIITRKQNMTAAHLLSVGDNGEFGYQLVIRDLEDSTTSRKSILSQQQQQTRDILMALDPQEWKEVLGYAGEKLAQISQVLGKDVVAQDTKISTIIALNSIENVASAGAGRLYGKPVAWHLENVGLWGEVSGGERIYGKAEGEPQAIEYHSLFAYMFDAYTATALEWAAEGREFVSIDEFYSLVRNRIAQKDPEHWTKKIENLGDFVDLCKQNKLEYSVKFRSADTYPLVAVSGVTDPSCVDSADNYWKDWPTLRGNLTQFINGVRDAYTR